MLWGLPWGGWSFWGPVLGWLSVFGGWWDVFRGVWEIRRIGGSGGGGGGGGREDGGVGLRRVRQGKY